MAFAAVLRWVKVEDAGAKAAADGIDAARIRATAAAAAHVAAKIRRLLVLLGIMVDSLGNGAVVPPADTLENESPRFNDVLDLWCVANLAHIFMRFWIWIRTKPRMPRVEQQTTSQPP